MTRASESEKSFPVASSDRKRTARDVLIQLEINMKHIRVLLTYKAPIYTYVSVLQFSWTSDDCQSKAGCEEEKRGPLLALFRFRCSRTFGEFRVAISQSIKHEIKNETFYREAG